MKTLFRALALAAVTAAAPAVAETFENIDRLEARLIGALDANIGEPGGPAAPIDRRLRLAPCPQPATIDPPALGAVALRCPAVGWRIRVPLVRTGSASPMMAKAAPVVRRGDPVELTAGSRGFSVSAQAIAQEDGSTGDRIRIKTDPKSAPIFAEVVAPGIVRMPGFK
jgi:flagella basal body P-ring formation protein FlgA